MKNSTILLILACGTLLFSGCVIPADSYYSDPYYHPGVVIVPALPYTVDLYDQRYYNYRGYYYFYNNQRWYYSRTNGGHWVALPRTHWPHETRWQGRHFYNDHRDHKHGGQESHPPKNSKYRSHENPRRDDKHQDKHRKEKSQHYKNTHIEDANRSQKNPIQKERRHDEKDQQKKYFEKRGSDPRQHDHNKVKQDRSHQKRTNMHPTKKQQRQDGKKTKEDEPRPDELKFKHRL